jgi:hypothetical protein
VRILGMVQSTTEFEDHPKVMNGFPATVELHDGP